MEFTLSAVPSHAGHPAGISRSGHNYALLDSWHTIEADWPEDRSFAAFQKWFHVELQSDATDLGISECTRFETRIFGWNGSVSVSGGQGVLATGEFSGANSGGYHRAHGHVSTFAVFIGPYVTTYVEPQYRLNRNGVAGAVKITPSKSTFHGFKFKRAR